MIKKISLDELEVQNINLLLKEIIKRFITPEDPDFLHEASVLAHGLPLRIRSFINDFRLKEVDDACVCVISGYSISNEKIGLTPTDRGSKSDTPQTLEEQVFLVLLGALLGDPIAWSTQQAGYVVHDVFPVLGQECDQTGSSSKQELLFHTEDAFHPYRGDYLGMMCLRNEGRQSATTLVSRAVVASLPEDVVRILFEPRFVIRPDASQFERHRFAKIDELSEDEFQKFLVYSNEKIHEMNSKPKPISILFGSPAEPYLRVDCSVYMDALDDEAEAAAEIFTRKFNESLYELDMEPGEICFIDNLRVAHGRSPFRYPARYDGNDRWLKRINVTRDLRKSRDMRMTNTSRIIF